MRKQDRKDIPEAERLEGLKDMSFGKKLEYFWMYDKWVVGIAVAVLAVGIGGYRWYQESKIQTVLSISAVNSVMEDSASLVENIREEIGATGKYETVSISSNLIADTQTGELDYYSQVGYIAQINAKAIDILLVPETVARKLSEQDVFYDLSALLGEEYGEYESLESYGCLNVSETEIPELYGMAEPVYLGVIVNTVHPETARQYIETVIKK